MPQFNIEMQGIMNIGSPNSVEKQLATLQENGSLQKGIIDFSSFAFTELKIDVLNGKIIDIKKNQECKSWQVLNLRKCNLGGSTSISSTVTGDSENGLPSTWSSTHDPAKIIALGKLLENHDTFTHIDLGYNNFIETECGIIIHKLKSHRDLRRLNLDGNRLGDKAINALCSILTNKNCMLKYLSLKNCKFTEGQISQLAIALKKNSSLRELDISKISRNEMLNDDSINALLGIFPDNTSLVAICLYGTEDAPKSQKIKGLCEELEKKLGINRNKRKEKHDSLMATEHILVKSQNEILRSEKDNEPNFFATILGDGIKRKDATTYYYNLKKELTIERAKAKFTCNFMRSQIKLMEEYKSKEINDKMAIEKQYENNIIIAKKMAQEIIEDLLNTVNLKEYDSSNDKFEPLRKGAKAIIVGNFLNYDYKNIINDLNENIVIASADGSLKNAKNKLESAEKLIAELDTKFKAQEKEYNDYMRAFEMRCEEVKYLDLSEEEFAEYEELEEHWADANIDVNALFVPVFDPEHLIETKREREQLKTTLLHLAFTENKPKIVEALLKCKNINIFIEDSEGQTVFNWALTDENRNACHRLVLNHIKKKITDIWPQIVQDDIDEIKDLEEIKKILDSYLDKLIEVNSWPKWVQFFRGRIFHLEQRNQEITSYYKDIQEASKFLLATSLATILDEMEDTAEKSHRGIRGRSQLHDSVLKTVVPVRKKLLRFHPEYIARVKKANQRAKKLMGIGEQDDTKERLAQQEDTIRRLKAKQEEYQKQTNLMLKGIIESMPEYNSATSNLYANKFGNHDKYTTTARLYKFGMFPAENQNFDVLLSKIRSELADIIDEYAFIIQLNADDNLVIKLEYEDNGLSAGNTNQILIELNIKLLKILGGNSYQFDLDGNILTIMANKDLLKFIYNLLKRANFVMDGIEREFHHEQFQANRKV